MNNPVKILLIGGSAGSIPVLINVLKKIPPTFDIPIIIILHRMKNVVSELDKILAFHLPKSKIIEPDDKQLVSKNCIYLAPQNYHLLFEEDGTFSLDYSETVHYSRPSIDVAFESASNIFKQHCLAILLSGANADGTEGVKKIIESGGVAIVQDPASTEYSFMPQHAIDNNTGVTVLTPGAISKHLQSYIQ